MESESLPVGAVGVSGTALVVPPGSVTDASRHPATSRIAIQTRHAGEIAARLLKSVRDSTRYLRYFTVWKGERTVSFHTMTRKGRKTAHTQWSMKIGSAWTDSASTEAEGRIVCSFRSPSVVFEPAEVLERRP